MDWKLLSHSWPRRLVNPPEQLFKLVFRRVTGARDRDSHREAAAAPTNLCQLRPAVARAGPPARLGQCVPYVTRRASTGCLKLAHLSSRHSLHRLCLRSFGVVARL